MRSLILAMLVVAALLAGCGERNSVQVSAGRIEAVTAQAPTDDVHSLVIYVSDIAGWDDEDRQIVDELVAHGSAVISLDLSNYAAKLNADKGACLYVTGELTDLAQQAQRALGIDDYLPPILVGRGEGATFAYAALADAPANTLGGAVAAGFDNRLSLRLPFCPGATANPLPGAAGFSYSFDHELPQDARLLVAPGAFARIKADAASQAHATVDPLSTRTLAAQIVHSVGTLRTAMGVEGLPVVPLRAEGAPKGLVIFVSGDGGWRDLDKTIGEWMATQGYEVLGLDALRYFWSEKQPDRFAADLGRLIRKADPAAALPVLLVGYSFGADTLPFAWPHLPAALRERIGLVALLGPSLSTGFQISVSGWLGLAGRSNAVVPAIAAMPARKVLCVHGADETSSACANPALGAADIIETGGGHHFDGDYAGLGRRILEAFEGRSN